MRTALSLLSPPAFEAASRDSFDASLWSATATPKLHYTAFSGAKTTQVAVVGAGYTGLATAIELARRGVEVTVVDAFEPGYGASGRNGGQIIPLFKYEPEDLLKKYGEAVGAGVLDMVSRSANDVFDMVRRFNIDCELSTAGWIQPAVGEAGELLVKKRFNQWKTAGAAVELLDAAALQTLLGSSFYGIGWLHRGAGSVQPLSYARGLARAAVSLGAQIYGRTPIRKIDRIGNHWRLTADQGELIADSVVLATNGYTTDLWPGLRQSIVPLYSMQIATEPLAAELGEQILPGGHCAADTRRLVWYFRKDLAGRFIIGTRGPFNARPDHRDGTSLIAAARSLYPALREVEFPYIWAGRVAMTADRVPHMHQLAAGVFTALGYNGRGVAMATTMGRLLAAACLGESNSSLYPITDLQPIPFHAFHRLGVHAMVSYYRLLDRIA